MNLGKVLAPETRQRLVDVTSIVGRIDLSYFFECPSRIRIHKLVKKRDAQIVETNQIFFVERTRGRTILAEVESDCLSRHFDDREIDTPAKGIIAKKRIEFAIENAGIYAQRTTDTLWNGELIANQFAASRSYEVVVGLASRFPDIVPANRLSFFRDLDRLEFMSTFVNCAIRFEKSAVIDDTAARIFHLELY